MSKLQASPTDEQKNVDSSSKVKSLEEKGSKDVEIVVEVKTSKEYQIKGSPNETRLQIEPPPGAYAIMEHERNSSSNTDREATHVAPLLVRRIDSAEILPTPFRTTKQLIILTYATCWCCCLCGVFATKAAMQTKILRNKGCYVAASKQARKAVYYMLASIICGLVIFVVIISNIAVYAIMKDK